MEMKHETSSGLHQPRQGEEAMHVMSPFEDNPGLYFWPQGHCSSWMFGAGSNKGFCMHFELWATLGKWSKWHYM